MLLRHVLSLAKHSTQPRIRQAALIWGACFNNAWLGRQEASCRLIWLDSWRCALVVTGRQAAVLRHHGPCINHGLLLLQSPLCEWFAWLVMPG